MSPQIRPTGRPTRIPAEPGIWIIVGGDLLVFSMFFVIFSYYHGHETALFAQSHLAMSQGLGLLGTLLLLGGSWCVALAVHSVRHQGSLAPRCIGLAIMCGVGFVGIKAIDWGMKFAVGTSLLTNDYFMLYFMFTGVHLFHVLIAIGVLVLLWRMARRDHWDARAVMLFEAGSIFWHLVDLLWIVLFALFYLIR